MLGFEGTDYLDGTPHGLVVPGQGPGLRIKAGHKYGWITLHVAQHESEPPADVTQWEAIEEATIEPTGEVRVADDAGNIQQPYPDLTGGRHLAYLTIRASVRGRDSQQDPRRTPVEHHLIEAWPATEPAPHRVLKRDNLSRRYEAENRRQHP